MNGLWCEIIEDFIITSLYRQTKNPIFNSKLYSIGNVVTKTSVHDVIFYVIFYMLPIAVQHLYIKAVG